MGRGHLSRDVKDEKEPAICRGNPLGKGKSKYEDPEARRGLGCSRNKERPV